MSIKRLARYFVLAFAFFCLPIAAHEYAPGKHQWKVKGGTITLVSSLVTNGMALYARNYNFYFQKTDDHEWYHIPILEKGKPGLYELNITTKAKDERMVRDARLEIKDNDIYLLHARSTQEDDFKDAPIVITKYRFVVTDGEDWPYFFQLVSSKIYPARKDLGVDTILRQEAKQIK